MQREIVFEHPVTGHLKTMQKHSEEFKSYDCWQSRSPVYIVPLMFLQRGNADKSVITLLGLSVLKLLRSFESFLTLKTKMQCSGFIINTLL